MSINQEARKHVSMQRKTNEQASKLPIFALTADHDSPPILVVKYAIKESEFGVIIYSESVLLSSSFST